MTKLNRTGQALVQDIARGASIQNTTVSSQNIHVVGAGGVLTAAYEQLRNAAEYTEEHVLLQRAIRRFYRRLFLLKESKRIASSGEELIVELTLAGYLQNDSVSEALIPTINQKANAYYAAYEGILKRKDLRSDSADKWTFELLAVEIDSLLNNTHHDVFVQFSYTYLLESLDFTTIFDRAVPEDAETALYVAVHRALFKSDDAVVRLGLLRRYQYQPDSNGPYVELNTKIDQLFRSPSVERLLRIVDRRGAPLRVLRRMVDEQPDMELFLHNRDQFLSAFESQVNSEYATINSKVNNGIIKSVIFLIITKFLIGIAIEVPYDYFVAGMILWVPLLINLFFPPVYMILLRSTMMLPGPANTRRLINQIDTMLYQQETPKQLMRRTTKTEFGSGYNVAYAGLFIFVFGGVAFALWRFLEFDLVHLFIFFVFLSAASFLGFRLSRMIREIESIETHQNGITLTRDFLYMPFVVVGRYLSDKYSKINVVALALDMLIELPLKTILRLIRQWSAFISAKKDEL